MPNPWLGLYGEPDDNVPAGEIDKLRELAGTAGMVTDIVTFPNTDHRFDRNPVAAHEAWQRTRNWFDLHLR